DDVKHIGKHRRILNAAGVMQHGCQKNQVAAYLKLFEVADKPPSPHAQVKDDVGNNKAAHQYGKRPEYFFFQVALAVLFPPGAGLFFIITHFGTLKQRVIGIVTGLKDAVLGIVTDLKDRVIALVEGIGTGIARVAATVYNAAWQLAVDTKNSFFAGLGWIAGWGQAIAIEIWNGIVSWAGNLYYLARDFGATVAGQITGGIGFSKNWGLNIVTGLWNGISARAQWLYNKVYDFAKGIYDSIKGALGSIWPGSPSQAGIDIGKGLVAGIEKGIGGALAGLEGATVGIRASVMGATPAMAVAGGTATVGRPLLVVVELDGRQIARVVAPRMVDELRVRTGRRI
ncbi:hypothetical protein LCGC14_1243010, partial [marine sediment metagenome]